MLADKVASAELSVELGWLVAGTGKLAVLEGHRVFACHTFGRLIRRREMGWHTLGKETFSFCWALEAWQGPLGQIARE